MPRKKNKRKGRSKCPVSKVERITVQNTIDRSYLAYLHGKGKILVDKITGQVSKPDPLTESVMTLLEYRWNITAYILGKEDVENYFKSSEVLVNQPCKTDDIGDYVQDEFDEMIKNFNNVQYKTLGWIADPKGGSVDDLMAYKVFNNLGAWNA